MDHSHHHMPDAAALVAPEWLISSIGILFLGFAGFYLWRLFRPTMVKNAIGFFDWEGEAGHFICMLAMASHMAAWLIPIPGIAWSWILGFGTLYYAARAMTWGKRLTYNKQWWDWTHSAMFLGMFTMFQPLPLAPLLLTVFNGAMVLFWVWFSGYYVKDSVLDARAGKHLSFTSDLAHLSMGVAMLLMALFPALLMPGHGHHHHGSAGTPANTQQCAPMSHPMPHHESHHGSHEHAPALNCDN
jgi:hypothetical protein